MEFTLKFLFYFFLLLSAAMGQSDMDAVEDVEEKARQFHIEQNKETREFIKSEMDWYFTNLWEKLQTELNKNQETLSASLTRRIDEKVENLFVNLMNSFNEKQSRSELKMESSLLNISETFTRKLSMSESKIGSSLEGLSNTLDEKLLRIEAKLTEDHGSLNETLHQNHQQLSSLNSNLRDFLTPLPTANGSTNVSSVWTQTEMVSTSQPPAQLEIFAGLPFLQTPSNSTPSSNSNTTTTPSKVISAVPIKSEIISTSQPPVQTEVEEVNLREGTIEFAGGANPHLRRKIWVFQSEGGTAFAFPMRFALQENNLGADARLSLWGSEWEHGYQHVWTGSQSDWREEQWSEGNVILVTLLISPSASEQPSFKLKFKTTVTYDGVVPSSQLVVGEGRQVVSFPPNNTQNFHPESLFVAVVAPPSGGPFQMNLKFLDLPRTPADFCHSTLRVSFLEESPNGLPYELLPASAHRQCGQPGVISEPIGHGNATVAIVRLYGNNGKVGKGFRIEIN